ncbi:MAG: hypothetical protein ACTSYI_07400 [Promethearchaeota archaeon]
MKTITLKTWKIIFFSTIFLIALGIFAVFSFNGLELVETLQFENLMSSISFLEKIAVGGGGLPSSIGFFEKIAVGGGGLPSSIMI